MSPTRHQGSGIRGSVLLLHFPRGHARRPGERPPALCTRLRPPTAEGQSQLESRALKQRSGKLRALEPPGTSEPARSEQRLRREAGSRAELGGGERGASRCAGPPDPHRAGTRLRPRRSVETPPEIRRTDDAANGNTSPWHCEFIYILPQAVSVSARLGGCASLVPIPRGRRCARRSSCPGAHLSPRTLHVRRPPNFISQSVLL